MDEAKSAIRSILDEYGGAAKKVVCFTSDKVYVDPDTGQLHLPTETDVFKSVFGKYIPSNPEKDATDKLNGILSSLDDGNAGAAALKTECSLPSP